MLSSSVYLASEAVIRTSNGTLSRCTPGYFPVGTGLQLFGPVLHAADGAAPSAMRCESLAPSTRPAHDADQRKDFIGTELCEGRTSR
jgi:hypothetical protein